MPIGGAEGDDAIIGNKTVPHYCCRSASSQPGHPGTVSLDAAARLSRLEQAVAGQRDALAAAERRFEKANLRYRLYNADVKRPLQQVRAEGPGQAHDVHSHTCPLLPPAASERAS